MHGGLDLSGLGELDRLGLHTHGLGVVGPHLLQALLLWLLIVNINNFQPWKINT